MAFNPEDYPTQYTAIKSVWNKWVSGKTLQEIDKLEYYGAKSEMFKSKFISTKADHHKERQYLRKHLTAESGAEKIARKINSARRDSELAGYCQSIINAACPNITARFWGI